MPSSFLGGGSEGGAFPFALWATGLAGMAGRIEWAISGLLVLGMAVLQ